MAKRSIQDLKAELQKFKSVTPWEEVKAGEVYHIAPIVSLERRDVKIVSKDGESATYRRVDEPGTAEERRLHKSSVFSKFLVKKKVF